MTSVGKKRVRISSPGSDSDDRVPESEKKGNTCFVCDGTDDWVLVCHGEECLISIHQSCTCDEPDFDEFGNFFCPYCWYKSLKLRDKLSAIEKSRVGVSENVNGSQGNDESYEKFMAMEKDQRREEVAAETQSQEEEEEEVRFSEKNHVPKDGDKDDEQIEHQNEQELAMVIHQPIEAQPFSTVPPQRNGTAGIRDPGRIRKRKRVFWTQAEEEMLKVGVQKFPGVRNIPWRKILKFGRNVFHEDRAPSDLKDKWKMIVKLSERQPNHP
ncbi:hypothetical protein HA466_0132630 [Hirschfeldia incana]|nr:hypothetical protein HA466_0132630 [Hirschfeldia incana]